VEDYQNGFALGGNVLYTVPNLPFENGCFAAQNGSPSVGTPIVFEPCTVSTAQTFAPYGSPTFVTLFWSLANGEYLNNIAFGWQLDTSSSAPNASMYFTYAADAYAGNEIMQYNPNYQTAEGPGDWECLAVTSISGTVGTLAMTPCEGTASQQWYPQLTNANGSDEWVSALQGETKLGGRFVSTQECVQNDGTLEECNGQNNQFWYDVFNP